jgi:serine/threonine protein kinase
MADGSGPGIPETLSHYRLSRLLGKGGMGMVYEGVDRRDDSRVAVKLLYPHLSTDPEFRDRFEREAHVAALLRSPYTVHVLAFGIEQGWYYLVMEFVEGTAVGDLLKNGPLQPMEALRIAGDVARALEEAGARGVTHRDIKPENILVTTEGRIKVADFGIARQESGGSLTMGGGFVGTPLYAAPEQASGQSDHRSDIYALGVTLYAMLAGRPPFSGSPFDVIQQHRTASIPMGNLSYLPDSVVNLVRRCMEKHPADRYQTAGELGGALERARQSLIASGASGSTPRPVSPQAPAPSYGSSVSGGATAAAGPGQTPPGAFPPQSTAPRPATPPPAGTPPRAPTPPPISAEPTRVSSFSSPPTVAAPHQAQPQPVPAAQARHGVQAQLHRQGSGGSRMGWTTFELVVAGSAFPRNVRFQGYDTQQATEVLVPAGITVPVGQNVTVPVKVRPRSRRWFGATLQRGFGVTVSDDSGGPGSTVTLTGQYDDLPRGWPVVGPALAIAAGAIVPIALFAGGVFGGGGGGGASPDPTRTATATPTERETEEPTKEATPTPTETATQPPAPDGFIEAGDWTYTFVVRQNNCSFGLGPGETFEITYSFKDLDDDGNVTEGELVDIYDESNFYVGRFTLTYPEFEFSYPVLGNDSTVNGVATVRNSYTSSNSGSATLTEVYETNPPCEIFGSD